MYSHRHRPMTIVIGTAEPQMPLRKNIDFLKSSHEPYVIIASGDCVYKMDMNKLLNITLRKMLMLPS